MKTRILYISLSTLVIAAVAASMAAIMVARAGLLPVRADTAPSKLEKKFFTMALHSSVSRSAAAEAGYEAPTDADLQTGGDIYKAACAECHGQPNGKPSKLGASFYPPAPQLPGRATSYSDSEVFWIVKHGIRNTAMPAWSSLLSDEQIGQVTAFVKQLNAQSDQQASAGTNALH